MRIRPKVCKCQTKNAPTVRLELFNGGKIPAYARDGDAGVDLVANEDVTLWPWSRALVKTGIKVEIPYGYVGLVHPRSGLALNTGITVLNAPGTIDSGYRGEVGVILFNTTDVEHHVKTGDRIAQLVFQKVETVEFEVVDALTESDRGEGGFGSTGV